jgi:hypothetical protein
VFLILQPLPETVALVEDIVVEYVTDLVSLFCVSMILSSVLSAQMLCVLIVRLCEWKEKKGIDPVFNDSEC